MTAASPIRMRATTALGILLLFLLVPGTLFSEISDPLRVAVMPDLFPVSFLNERGDPDGVFPMVVMEFALENDIAIEWVHGSLDENMERARLGELDLMTCLIRTDERDTFLDFNNEPVISSWSQVFQYGSRDIESVLDMEGLRVGMVIGDQNARGFTQLAESFGISYDAVDFDSFNELTSALEEGETDAGVFYSLYHLAQPQLIPTSVIFQPNTSFFAIPEGADPEVLELMDTSLRNWKADSESVYRTRILTLLSPAANITPRWVLPLVAALVGFAIVAVVFLLVLRQQVRSRTTELLRSQSVYRHTFMDAVMGIVHLDTGGMVLRANPAFCEFLNCSPEDLPGKSYEEFIVPEDLPEERRIFEFLHSRDRQAYRSNLRFRTSDRQVVWGSMSVSVIRDDEGNRSFFTVLVEDITPRMNAEKKLGDLESRYLGLFENSFQMTAILDELGRLLDVNDTLKKEFDILHDTADYLGLTPDNLDWLGPVVSLRVQEMVDSCLATGQTIRQTLGSAETVSGRSLDLSIKPVTDEAGSIRYCIVEAHDVTELMALTGNLERQVEERTREIKVAHSQLMEAERMASLGRLVAGVAHEINTPVGVARTGVSYLTEQVTDIRRRFDERTLSENDFKAALDSFEDLSGILEENLGRAVKLIQDFRMTSADQSSGEIRQVNIREYLNAIMHAVGPKLKKSGIVWNVDAPDEEDCIHVGALNPVLVNLAINTVSHAFPEGHSNGVIDIIFRKIGDHRLITFSDNGRGVEENLISQIFEPFYTTGRSRGFTGLGLNIVHNLVTDIMNGRISCESRPGEGTAFRIEYPEPTCAVPGNSSD